MATAATVQFTNLPEIGLYPKGKRSFPVQIAPSVTLAKGTVLGEFTPVNDVQTLTETGSPTGGTFTITVTINGIAKTTTALAYNITKANMQTALRLLPNVGTAVAVTGTDGGPWILTFSGALAGQTIPLVTVDSTALAGGTTPAVTPVHTTPGINAGTYGAYASGHSDGTQVAKCILEFDVVTDSSGIITIGQQSGGGEHHETSVSVSALFSGDFLTAELTGLDATAVTALGRLIEGTTTAGILRMP
jgi:hypothetical protein